MHDLGAKLARKDDILSLLGACKDDLGARLERKDGILSLLGSCKDVQTFSWSDKSVFS